jgi:voltage-gated potassium channel
VLPGGIPGNHDSVPARLLFPDCSAALWWTAMLLTTMGTEDWPRTPEGRVLCLLLAIYAFAVFGYVTAAIAAYFVGQDQNAVSTSRSR